jgi:hypothetical protein
LAYRPLLAYRGTRGCWSRGTVCVGFLVASSNDVGRPARPSHSCSHHQLGRLGITRVRNAAGPPRRNPTGEAGLTGIAKSSRIDSGERALRA